MRANPGAYVLERLTDDEFRAFLDLWNALPPESSLEADALTAFYRSGARTVAVAWYLEGCVLFWGEIPIETYGALRSRPSLGRHPPGLEV